MATIGAVPLISQAAYVCALQIGCRVLIALVRIGLARVCLFFGPEIKHSANGLDFTLPSSLDYCFHSAECLCLCVLPFVCSVSLALPPFLFDMG